MPPKQESAAEKSVGKKIISAKHKPTIGIIGLDKSKVAKLNQLIVKAGNEAGLGDDQEHPAVFAVGLSHDEINISASLENHANLCYAFGCDIIAITSSSSGESSIKKYIKETLKIDIIHRSPKDSEDDLDQLAKKIIQETLDYTRKIKRPNLNNYPTSGNLDKKTEEALKEDREQRSKRLSEKLQGKHIEKIKSPEIYGVLGGAGPAASAKFCEHLASKGFEFIHCSENSAPGKHRFENEGGPSYIPFYLNIMEFFQEINLQNVAIPCNTAHKRLKEFCPESMTEKIKDFREAVVRELKHAGYQEAILLGTNATVGVNNNNEIGIYARYCQENSDHFNFIVPNKEQQKEIINAIYLVKKGDPDGAKKLIKNVIAELRKHYGTNLPAILACTELPLAFLSSELERAEEKFLDPARLLLSRTRALSISSKSSSSNSSSEDSSNSDDEKEAQALPKVSFNFKAWAEETKDGNNLNILISLQQDSETLNKSRDSLTAFTHETIGALKTIIKEKEIISKRHGEKKPTSKPGIERRASRKITIPKCTPEEMQKLCQMVSPEIVLESKKPENLDREKTITKIEAAKPDSTKKIKDTDTKQPDAKTKPKAATSAKQNTQYSEI